MVKLINHISFYKIRETALKVKNIQQRKAKILKLS